MSTRTPVKNLQNLLSMSHQEAKKIPDPLLRAIALAFLKEETSGDWYQVRANADVQDFDFAFLGFHGQPQTHQKGLWLRECHQCRKKVPALIIRKKFHLKEPIPNRFGEYKEKVESQSSLFTLEDGKIYLDGFLSLKDLMKEKEKGNHHGN